MAESLPPKKTEDREETLEFLKREEVRTMAKDMARLREEEAKKERERIVKIKAGEPKKETPVPKPQPVQAFGSEPQSRRGAKTLSGPERPAHPSLMPHAKDLPDGRQEQKPVFLRTRTRSEKILIRAIVMGVILFVLLNGIAFGYWFFTKKKVVEITPEPQPSASAESTVDETELGNGNQVSPTPIVFFETVQEKTIDLSATDNLITLLSDSFEEEYPQGFTRIFIRNEGGAFLTTREFLNRVGVAAPEPLLSLLEEDFMLFVYSSPARKRLGIIGEFTQAVGTEQQRSNILTGWETTLEQDTKPLWEIVGQKGSAYTSFFRQTAHQNSLVRFQTFSVVDFGIVYTLFDTKLVLTTSFESVTKAVDQIIQSRP